MPSDPFPEPIREPSTGPRIGSLCSGYGGLTLAVLAAFGGRVVWHSEYEPPSENAPNPKQSAAKVLAHRWPDVPNLGDMTQIDWYNVEPVEIMEGGTPCQDVSGAGRRAGMREGTRSNLWRTMVEGIQILRPNLVVWENVRGVLHAGADCDLEHCPVCMGEGSAPALRALGRVLGDLADVGYDTQWCGLPASAVGAPHGRFREFVLAWPSGGAAAPADSRGVRRGSGRVSGSGEASGGGALGESAGRGAPAAADAASSAGRRPEQQDMGATGGPAAESGERPGQAASCGWCGQQHGAEDACLASVIAGEHTDWGAYAPAIDRWAQILGRPAPSPRRDGSAQLNAEFSEWMMGLPPGWVTAVPGLSNSEMLHVLGNGVVPQQAVAALEHMRETA